MGEPSGKGLARAGLPRSVGEGLVAPAGLAEDRTPAPPPRCRCHRRCPFPPSGPPSPKSCSPPEPATRSSATRLLSHLGALPRPHRASHAGAPPPSQGEGFQEAPRGADQICTPNLVTANAIVWACPAVWRRRPPGSRHERHRVCLEDGPWRGALPAAPLREPLRGCPGGDREAQNLCFLSLGSCLGKRPLDAELRRGHSQAFRNGRVLSLSPEATWTRVWQPPSRRLHSH